MRVASDYKPGDVVEVDTSTDEHRDRWTPARVTKVDEPWIHVQYISEFDSTSGASGRFIDDCVRPNLHWRIAEAVRRRHVQR